MSTVHAITCNSIELKMMDLVNQHRNSTILREQRQHKKCVEFLGNLLLAILGIFDKVRMLIRHEAASKSFSNEQNDLRKDRLDIEIC
jgi:transcriptional regulator of aromatic amino acid metabolism